MDTRGLSDQREPGTTEGALEMVFRARIRIGRGGESEVFAGVDATGRRAAIKMTRKTTAPALARLRAEAELLRALRSPYMPNYYASGCCRGGRLWLAMEWIEGESLASRIKRCPLSPTETIELGASIAAALHALHSFGVLHRDLKPANIILPPRSLWQSQVPKLIDFGIRGDLVGSSSDQRTRGGRLSGTPYYMAPEQLAGRPQSPRTDLFALGVVLLVSLTGRLPVRDATFHWIRANPSAPRMPFGPFVIERLFESISVPSDIELPDGLRTVLTHLLRNDPMERPASAQAVHESLTSMVG